MTFHSETFKQVYELQRCNAARLPTVEEFIDKPIG
jgi:hypothetical protein